MTNWIPPFSGSGYSLGGGGGGGGGGGPRYALGVDTIADRNAIPAGERSEFLSVYVAETDRWYTLIGGIANTDWQLRDTARKVNDRPGLVGPIYVTAAGSDVNGTGSVGAPYATLSRAILDLGTQRTNTNININVGAGVFAPPDTWVNVNWATVVGTTSVIDTGNVNGVAIWSPTSDWFVDVVLLGAYGPDALKGRYVSIAGGTYQGFIYRNDATVLGVTRIYMGSDTLADFVGPAPGDLVNIFSLDTTIRDSSTAVSSFTSNTRLNFNDVIMEAAAATNVHFFVATDKVEFVRCAIQNLGRYQAGQGGGFFLNNCYYRANGASGLGILRVAPGGLVRLLRGTIIDGGASVEPLVTDPDAILSYLGRTVMLDVVSIQAAGSTWLPAQETTMTDPSFYFSGTAMSRGGISWNSAIPGVGGDGRLPGLFGSVTSSYAVLASQGANLSLRTSSVASTLGFNHVSADAGLTNTAQYLDGTYIAGGNVFPGCYTAQRSVSADTFLGATDSLLLVDATAGPVFVDLPTILQYPFRTYTVKKVDASVNAVTVRASFGQTIDGLGTYTIVTTNVARAFNSGPSSGTNWSVT